ncbi:MAG: hypothetical protein HY941_12595 [Gammaproteobacteria bacterium]|nr:hypothetical protein [Gammaproteobacteria bacterium]
MAGVYINRANPMLRQDGDKGYRVAWKLKYGFQKSRFDKEMTYGEARKQAAELQAKEPEKVFWAEMMMDPHF